MRNVMQHVEVSSVNPLIPNTIAYFPLLSNDDDTIGTHTASEVSVSYNSDAGYFQDTADFTAGNTSAVIVDDADDLSFGNGLTEVDFSFDFVVNINVLNSVQVFFGKRHSSGGSLKEYIMFYNNGNNTLEFRMFDQSAGKQREIKATAFLSIDTEYHITFTFNASLGTGQIYINATTISAATTTEAGYVAMENLTGKLAIGKTPNNTTQSVDGYMAEFLILDKELSQLEIDARQDDIDNGIPFN